MIALRISPLDDPTMISMTSREGCLTALSYVSNDPKCVASSTCSAFVINVGAIGLNLHVGIQLKVEAVSVEGVMHIPDACHIGTRQQIGS